MENGKGKKEKGWERKKGKGKGKEVKGKVKGREGFIFFPKGKGIEKGGKT